MAGLGVGGREERQQEEDSGPASLGVRQVFFLFSDNFLLSCVWGDGVERRVTHTEQRCTRVVRRGEREERGRRVVCFFVVSRGPGARVISRRFSRSFSKAQSRAKQEPRYGHEQAAAEERRCGFRERNCRFRRAKCHRRCVGEYRCSWHVVVQDNIAWSMSYAVDESNVAGLIQACVCRRKSAKCGMRPRATGRTLTSRPTVPLKPWVRR